MSTTCTTSNLLGASDIRRIAASIGATPTKRWGQNFVIDPGTVRKIAKEAGISNTSHVIEVGPGLGSLTLAILETGAQLTAIEIDPTLATQLPQTVAEFMPEAADRFHVINQDALKVEPETLAQLDPALNDHPCTLVANLPYNVATPIILTLLEKLPNLTSFVVMVQKEVADRLSATPGSKVYGAPSVKLAWYGHAYKSANIGRNVFWPAPNVDSALVTFHRHDLTGNLNNPDAPNNPNDLDTTLQDSMMQDTTLRETTFRLIDTAFGQRRKTLNAVLRKSVSPEVFTQANIDPSLRGEALTVQDFTRLAQAVLHHGD